MRGQRFLTRMPTPRDPELKSELCIIFRATGFMLFRATGFMLFIFYFPVGIYPILHDF